MRNCFLACIASLLFVACGQNQNKDVAANNDTKISTDSIKSLAKEAYIYAFPAVEHNKALWKILVVNKYKPNHIYVEARMFSPADTTVVSVNNDTYYCPWVMDLRNEPVVISIPKIKNRDFCFQMVDIFTNCPDYISAQATGEGPGNYLIVRSDWNGTTPKGIDKVIKQNATVVLVPARIQVFGPTDKEAAILANQFKAMPLSEFAHTPAPKADSLVWIAKPYDSKQGDVEGFFRMFNYMIQYQLLSSKDSAMLNRFSSLGLGKGKDFKKENFKPEVWAAIEAGAKDGKNTIEAKTNTIGKSMNGWDLSPENAGRWGDDYLTNAAAAWKYIYVNTSEEAIYPQVTKDNNGEKLDGASHNYTVTFTKAQIPQVKFFWSLTIYNHRGFFVANKLNRYNLNSASNFKYNKDGSLTFYIQKDNPDKDKEANWLPAPADNFYMILRMYGASKEMISGNVSLPSVIKTN